MQNYCSTLRAVQRVVNIALMMGVVMLSSLSSAIAGNYLQPDDSVLVIGGAGRTGRLILADLESLGVPGTGLTRDIARATAEVGPYKWLEGDLTKADSLESMLNDVDYIVFAAAATIGTPGADPRAVDYGGVCDVAKRATEQGVRHMVLISALSVTHPSRIPMPPLQDALRWKKKGEDCLRSSGLPYTIIRPGRLVDQQETKQGVFLDQGDRLTAAVTSRADLAAVVLKALGNPDAMGKTCEVFNFETGWEVPWPVEFADIRRDAEMPPRTEGSL